jgi:biopolymer transport protein ExbB
MVQMLAHKFHEGGMIMWIILLNSAVGIAIIFERFRVIRGASAIKKDELLSHINSYILQGNLEKALQIVSQVRSPLTNIVRAGLVSVKNGKSAEEVQTAMDAVALREIPKIERRIPLLAMLSNIATLLGLVGTVTGMIGAFGAVSGQAAADRARMLASEIAVALNATAFGLVTGIFILMCFGFLQSMAQDAVDDIHEASVSTLSFILANRDKLQSRAS